MSFSGFGLSDMFLSRNAMSRSISAENPSGNNGALRQGYHNKQRRNGIGRHRFGACARARLQNSGAVYARCWRGAYKKRRRGGRVVFGKRKRNGILRRRRRYARAVFEFKRRVYVSDGNTHHAAAFGGARQKNGPAAFNVAGERVGNRYREISCGRLRVFDGACDFALYAGRALFFRPIFLSAKT